MLTSERSTYRILVVDDEPHIRQILKFTLEKAEYQVFCAADGEDALQKMLEIKPSLVLLDVMMPRMDGFEVCRKMRQDFVLSQIPVIMLTAKGDLNEKVRGLEGGANDYLVKPYSNDELLLRVRNVLEWNIRQKEANPLTGLPGNEAINDTLAARLATGLPFVAVYADLDNFKAYNDVYGYARGDQVILALARMLQEEGGEAGFVGHVGGDDFMLVLEAPGARACCDAILERFARFIPSFYSPEHHQAGGFPGQNRQGDDVFVPLMTLSLAYHEVSPSAGRTAMDVANVLAELKGQAKRQPGNSLFIDRRQ